MDRTEGGGDVDKLRDVELGVETFYVVQVKNATRISLKIDREPNGDRTCDE